MLLLLRKIVGLLLLAFFVIVNDAGILWSRGRCYKNAAGIRVTCSVHSMYLNEHSFGGLCVSARSQQEPLSSSIAAPIHLPFNERWWRLPTYPFEGDEVFPLLCAPPSPSLALKQQFFFCSTFTYTSTEPNILKRSVEEKVRKMVVRKRPE